MTTISPAGTPGAARPASAEDGARSLGRRRRPRRRPSGRAPARRRSPRKVGEVVDLGDAEARPGARGLDEDGQAERGHGLRHGLRVALERPRLDDGVRRDRQALAREHELHEVLVHADRRREHAGAHVAHVRELEHALEGAVLAVGPVQEREDDVDLAQHARHLARREHAQVPTTGRQREEDLLARRLDLRQPARGDLPARGLVGREDPLARRRDPDRDDVVARPVDGAQDARGGRGGDGVLARAPAEQHEDAGLAGAPVGCSSVDGTDRSGLWLDIADDPTGRLLARGRAPVRDPGNDPGGSGVGSAVEDTTRGPAADDPDHSPGRTGPGSERTHPRVPDDRRAVRAR